MKQMKTNIMNPMKTRAIIIQALLATCFSACTQDDIRLDGNGKDEPLVISSAQMTTFSTRAAIIQEGRLLGGEIGVTVEGNGARYSCENAKWTYSSDNDCWTSESTVLYEGPCKQNLYAYWPYSDNFVENQGIYITLPERQSTKNLSDYDYLCSDYLEVDTNPIDIEMHHAFPKVRVNITKNGTSLTNESISNVKLLKVGKNGYWNPGVKTYATTFSNVTMADVGDNSYEALVFPSDLKEFTVEVTTSNGRVFSTLVKLPSPMNANYKFNINLIIAGKNLIVVDNVSVTDWVDNPLENGTISEIE